MSWLHFLVVVAIAAAILYLAYRFAPKGWRTVAMNVVAGLATVGPDLLGVLLNFDWSVVVDRATAMLLILILNIGNVLVRFATSTAIGRSQ